jgi:DNA-binding CsgD family transcriptional regulator
VARKVLNFFKEKTSSTHYDLTPREMEVLEMMTRGPHAQEIAEALDISYYTVNNHMRHIYEKLHVGSDRQAVAKAWQEGLMPRIRNWMLRGK